MLNPEFAAICQRLQANVERGLPDQCADVMAIAAKEYRDPALWQAEMQQIFLRLPLLVALSCDVPNAGDYFSLDLLDRPLLVLRGDDGQVRVFLNICRHRGARLAASGWGQARTLVCPYHSWSYDRQGQLIGAPGQDSFGPLPVSGLIALPAEERHGAVFACLEPTAELQLDHWLRELGPALAALELDNLYPYRKHTTLASPNWKLAADGYLDGYHIGYLHKDSIGRKAITNRNTYDLLGPHVRVGFATKQTSQFNAQSVSSDALPDFMSLVHFVFPNVSISGGIADSLMLSRLHPGPGVHESTTVQHQYFRQPLNDAGTEQAETKRALYEQVVRDEDCATVLAIDAALPALANENLYFGRNEPGNQHLHRTIRSYLEG